LRRPRRTLPWFAFSLALALGLTLAFLVVPVLAIFLNTSPARLLGSLGEAESVEALRLSLETSAISVGIIVLVGTPAAYRLAVRPPRGASVVLTLIELPLVLPPAVAGIGLLAALGPRGVLGGALGDAHVQLVLTTAGVVVALTFVAAPFYLRHAHTAFTAMDRTYLEAAKALGARESTTFMRIAIPLARPGLVAGLALAWGRALGEFGATLMFAGSFQGVTQTVPLAIYEQFANDFPAALALSAVLVIVSAVLLVTVKLFAGSSRAPRAHGLPGPQPPM
jgi:molybdate transport system permease protein